MVYFSSWVMVYHGRKSKQGLKQELETENIECLLTSKLRHTQLSYTAYNLPEDWCQLQ